MVKCPKFFYILKFLIIRIMQTVHTQIRLLLKEQSDQGLYCLVFDYLYKNNCLKRKI